MADIYQAKDFEDWYKHHYETDYDGNNTWTQTFKGSDGKEKTIGDYDWQAGQKLYNLYQQGQQYQTEHDNEVTASAQRAMEAKIAADVSRQRLEKYLPQQLALQGLYGTGMSEDSYLKLQNQYQKAVGDANAMHNQNLKDYKSTLDGQKFGLNTQAQAAVQGVIDKKTADDEKVKADQQAAFAEARAAFTSASTMAELDEYKSMYEGRISSEMKTAFDEAYNSNKSEIEKKAKETPSYRASASGGSGNGKNLTVTLNDNHGGTQKLILESDGVVDADDDDYAVVDYAEKNVSVGEVFAYHGELYYYHSDGVARVTSRSGDKTDEKAYKILHNFLINGLASNGYIDQK